MSGTGHQEQRNLVWTSLLIEEWSNAAKQLADGGLPGLVQPNFAINPHANARFGCWFPERRLIELHERLLLTFPRDSVVEVLRHEIAHQVISELLGGDRAGLTHGEDWKRIARLLGCDDRAESCDSALRAHARDTDQGMIERVRKLMDHGRNAGTTTAEAAAFLRKARELMMRHQIAQRDLDEHALDQTVYTQRPVGQLFKRLPGYYHLLGGLLSDHYFVHYIQLWTRVMVDGKFDYRTHLELFGEAQHLDVAEYVCDQLLQRADVIWNGTRRELKKRGERPSKRAFMNGLFTGFSDSLEKEKEREDIELPPETRALILRVSAHRDRKYRDAYPKLRLSSLSISKDASHEAGYETGQKLKIRPGVGSGSGRKRLSDS